MEVMYSSPYRYLLTKIVRNTCAKPAITFTIHTIGTGAAELSSSDPLNSVLNHSLKMYFPSKDCCFLSIIVLHFQSPFFSLPVIIPTFVISGPLLFNNAMLFLYQMLSTASNV